MAENDYKHIVQDMTNVYFGGKLSYGEIMDKDETPFKFKTILSRYILKEVDKDTTLENHVFYITKDDESYMIYKQMKAKFRLNIFDENKKHYVSKEYKLDEIVDNEEFHKKMNTIFVEELHLTKLGLLAIG